MPEMSNSNFLFIEVQGTGKVPLRKDLRAAIQKHVMRDIGAARRGQPRATQLESVDGCAKHNPSSYRKVAPNNHRGKHPVRKGYTETITPTKSGYTATSANIPSPISGGCRTDPFMRFPIHMTSETSFLIDYCEYNNLYSICA